MIDNFNIKLDRTLNKFTLVEEIPQPELTNTSNTETNAEANKQQQKQLEQTQQNTQLSTKMAELDKQIAKIQAKIQGGANKPNDINQLNQLLITKKSLQDQFMRLNGVNPSAS